MVSLLLQAGFDPNIKRNGIPLLHYAIERGSLTGPWDRACIEMVLRAGADITSQDEDGYIALIVATTCGDVKMVKRFVGIRPELHLVDYQTHGGTTALHVASTSSELGHLMVKVLVEAGGNASIKDRNGFTPLHIAVGLRDENWRLLVVGTLLLARYDVNITNEKGETPLHLAVANGFKDAAELLRQHGGQE